MRKVCIALERWLPLNSYSLCQRHVIVSQPQCSVLDVVCVRNILKFTSRVVHVASSTVYTSPSLSCWSDYYIGIVMAEPGEVDGAAEAGAGTGGARVAHIPTTARPVVLPEIFDGSKSWGVAAVRAWDDADKLKWLHVRVTERAQKALHLLSEASRGTYAATRAALNQEATLLRESEFFLRFSPPERLHSDQGRNLESAVIREVWALSSHELPRTTLNQTD